ncbi:hypothetical protein WJX74_000881 [Apatococcus lobatus]|uniref:RING-type domain-containing protein n=1 Tax=Apatococcus lobatus TaxID=904363 RepID=A0AAW1RS18_9CHLO
MSGSCSPGCTRQATGAEAANAAAEPNASAQLSQREDFAMEQQEATAEAELARAKGKGKLLEIQEEPPEPPAVEIDDLTCAICLEQMKLADTAIIKGCEHSYCATCILSWKVVKEQAGCPQCKAPFSTLFTYRSLDGTLHDFPQEESVCLLARAQWFAAHLKEAEKGKQAMAEVLGQQPSSETRRGGGDWNDYSRYFEEYDEDEEVENYYFSAAAGRARIVLGNRRWGENGYVSAGRQHARPRVNQSTSKGKGKGSSGKAKVAAASPSTPNQPTPSQSTPSTGPQRANPPMSRPVPIPRISPQPSSNMPVREPHNNSPATNGDCSGASPSTPAGQHMKKGRKWQQQQAAARTADAAAGSADAAFGSSPGSDCGGSDSKGAHGRRARRNAKKAAADARALAMIPGM